jgi:anti-sigma factor RsiW
VELALRNATPTDADAEALRHVERCDRCRDELRMLTRVVAAARTAQLADLPAAPPERVWRRISGDLTQDTAAPRPPPRIPDHRKRAILALLALAAGIAVAHRCRRMRARPRRTPGPGNPRSISSMDGPSRFSQNRRWGFVTR